MKNKVSIIVPVYGVEKYIERCARSLFEQTFDSIEYIFVDDCSQDSSISILRRVMTDYPSLNIKIISKQHNEGLPQARKTGLDASTGDYVLHIDSDDWVEHTLVEKLYNLAIENDADMVYCNWVEEYETHSVPFNQPTLSLDNYYRSILSFKSFSYTWNRLVKRSLYKDVIFPSNYMLEDYVITSQLVRNATKAILLPEILIHYSKMNSGQSSMKEKRKQNMLQKVNNIMIVWNILHSSRNSNEYVFEQNNMIYYMLSILLWDRIIKLIDISVLNELVKELSHISFSRTYKNTILQQAIIKIVFGTPIFRVLC